MAKELDLTKELKAEEIEARDLFMNRLEDIEGIIKSNHEEDPYNCHVLGTIKGLNLVDESDFLEIVMLFSMDFPHHEGGMQMILDSRNDRRKITLKKIAYQTENDNMIYKYEIEVETRKGDIEGVYQGVDF